MSDELVSDLLRDYDGALLEIHLDNDDIDDVDKLLMRSYELATEAGDRKRIGSEDSLTDMRAAHSEGLSTSNTSSSNSDDAWMRLLLSSADLDLTLHEVGTAADAPAPPSSSDVDVSLADIAFEPGGADCQDEEANGGEDSGQEHASADSAQSQVPAEQSLQQWLDDFLLLTPTPPLLRLADAWSAGAAGSLAELDPGAAMPLSARPSDRRCRFPYCSHLALAAGLCYAHADTQALHTDASSTRSTKRSKTCRAIFGPDAQHGGMSISSSAHPLLSATTADGVADGSQQHRCDARPPLPPRRRERTNRRLSFRETVV